MFSSHLRGFALEKVSQPKRGRRFALPPQSIMRLAKCMKKPIRLDGRFERMFCRSTAAFFAGALFHHPQQVLAVRHGDVELHVTFADVRAGALV